MIVPPSKGGAGKVRVELKGTMIDYTARTDDELGSGDAVVIEEIEGEEIRVSKAPNELSQ